MHSVIGGNQPNEIEILRYSKVILICSCKKTTRSIRFRSMINDQPVMAESSFSLFFHMEHSIELL